MQALTWVIVKPAPRDFIENFVGASDFWGNKIRVQVRSPFSSFGPDLPCPYEKQR